MAAILFPVFARARENARRSSCQSNLKQIGLGIEQYKQDFDGKYCVYYMGNPGTGSSPVYQGWGDGDAANNAVVYAAFTAGTGMGWVQIIDPYLKSTQIFQCPSERHPAGTNPLSFGYSDYAYNSYIGWSYDGVNATTYLKTNETNIAQPALTVLVTDAYRMDGTDRSVMSSSAMAHTSGCDDPNQVRVNCGTVKLQYASAEVTSGISAYTGQKGAFRHLEGANYLLADGHVKWYTGDFTTGTSKKVWGSATSYSAAGGDPTFSFQ